jgi:hypothetical protein
MKRRTWNLVRASVVLMTVALIGGCDDDSGKLSFNERVGLAIGIVQDKYPDAKLYEAQGTATGGWTKDPDAVDHMLVVFQNAGNTSVEIEETAEGVFGAPVLISEPWLEDVVIDWPVKMDLPEANQLKERAGYNIPFQEVTLRNPLGPTSSNPYFIFSTERGIHILVDTVTGRVTME